MPIDPRLPYDENNVFAKILRGELPCDKIYEDDYALAFNDNHAVSENDASGSIKDIHVIDNKKVGRCRGDNRRLR